MDLPDNGKVYEHEFPYKNKTVILAQAADQTQHLLYLLNRTLPKSKPPKMYFMSIGTNNIGSARESPDLALAGIVALVDKLRNHSNATILLSALLPRYDDVVYDFQAPNCPWNDRIKELNVKLADFAAKRGPGVQLVDCSHVFAPVRNGSFHDIYSDMPDL